MQGGRIFTKSSERNYYEKQLIIELQGQHSTQGWALPGIWLKRVIICSKTTNLYQRFFDPTEG